MRYFVWLHGQLPQQGAAGSVDRRQDRIGNDQQALLEHAGRPAEAQVTTSVWSRNMTLGGPIDFKNIGLAKLLYKLRQHLDVYCLVAVNAGKLNAISGNFFGHLRQTEIDAICLSICKIYETERRFPLNSIPGVCQVFLLEDAKADDESAVRAFVTKHKGPWGCSPGTAGKLTAERFLEERLEDLKRFKECRDQPGPGAGQSR